MPSALLATKLTPPPRRPELVARPRLFEQLDLGATSGVTLVSAPAGFGKTTLVVEWLRSRAHRVAWLTVDEADNDPSRFFAYLLAAVRGGAPGIGADAAAMLEAPEPPPGEALLASLINDLAAQPEPLALVLDDFHLVERLDIHRQIAFLIDHHPPQLQIIVVSRKEPHMPLGRFRARFPMIEIGQEELRFSDEEAEEFLRRTMKARISTVDAAALNEKTEGWITGLQMAALSVHDQTTVQQFAGRFGASQRSVLEYLVEEVLLREPPRVQAFLLRTSVLDRMCAPLCDAIAPPGELSAAAEDEALGTVGVSSQAMLDYLERANLFVTPLDAEQHWYRYHRLFSEALRHRLALQGDGRVAELRKLACDWFAAHNFPQDAVSQALAANDWERAAELLTAVVEDLLSRGQFHTLIDWFRAMPPSIVSESPRLCLDFANALLLSGEIAQGEVWLERVREFVRRDPVPDVASAPRYQGELFAAESALARAKGEQMRAVKQAQLALEAMPQTQPRAGAALASQLGMAYWHSGSMTEAEATLTAGSSAARQLGNDSARQAATIFLGRVKGVRGELSAAAETFRSVVEERPQTIVTGIAHLDLAMLNYEWNDLAAAEASLRSAEGIVARSEHAEFRMMAGLIRARLLSARGDWKAALECVRDTERERESRVLPPVARAVVASVAILVALRWGDLRGAEQWRIALAPGVDANPFCRFVGLAEPRLLIALGEKRAAARALEGQLAAARQAGWNYAATVIRVLQATAADSPDRALPFLADALRRGERERFMRAFVDAGPALAPLLQKAARQGIAPAYAGAILHALAANPENAGAEDTRISGRELEVLRLMAEGLSNQAIGEKLTLSTGTVKTHVHNVITKLGAANRTEAVANARTRGLI